MRVICNAPQLTGDYGIAYAGQEFECSHEVGQQLLKSGLVRMAPPPTILYDTKVRVPGVGFEAPEVSARSAFRHLSVSDEKPQALAAESDPVLSESDLSGEGTTDPGGRRGRKGPGARR